MLFTLLVKNVRPTRLLSLYCMVDTAHSHHVTGHKHALFTFGAAKLENLLLSAGREFEGCFLFFMAFIS